MTPEQLREIYRLRKMRPVRTEYHKPVVLHHTQPDRLSGTSVRVVKPLANQNAGCCGRRRTTQ